MANKFTQYVRSVRDPVTTCLPLCHTTDGFHLRDILLTHKKLKPTQCPVFNELLLYLFYGRAAYRPSKEQSAVAWDIYFPVCFILDPSCITHPVRIFPFDSGAFESFLKEEMHAKMRLDDYLLDADMTILQFIVAAFYGSNESYFKKRAKSLTIGPYDYEVKAYYALINTTTKTKCDDRAHTVEIQTDKAIPMSKDTLLALVAPQSLLEDMEVTKLLTKCRAKALPYWPDHANPQEYIGVIKDRVRQYLIDKCFLRNTL